MVGYEIAGEVESVGAGVEDFEPGQRVMGGTRFGGYAELRRRRRRPTLLPLPEGWSFEEGAALPVVYAHRLRRASSASARCTRASAC